MCGVENLREFARGLSEVCVRAGRAPYLPEYYRPGRDQIVISSSLVTGRLETCSSAWGVGVWVEKRRELEGFAGRAPYLLEYCGLN